MKTLPSALLLACVLATSSSFAASGTADIAQKWVGTVKKGQDAVPVGLLLVAVQTGGAAGPIKWGEPYRCTSQLEYITQESGSWIFTLRKGYGPFCQSVDGARLYLKAGVGKTLQYRLLSPKDRSVLQETVLTAAP